jgi:hypothetical protein
MSPTPQTTFKQESEIFSELETVYQIDPVSLRRIFLILTRNHFADPNYFGEVPPSFKKFVYSDNNNKRTVKVDLDYSFNPEKTEQETAIYVGVGDVESTDQVMNNFVKSTEDLSGRENVQTDKCVVTIRHVSPSADEALIMGVISKGFFQGMRQHIKARLCLRGYSVLKLGKPVPVNEDSADSLYQCDLTIGVTMDSNWVTSSESHRVKRIDTNIVP